MKIILVDDEPFIIDMLKAIIDWNLLDIECVGTAGNGVDAYQLIRNTTPNIVITDIRLPGMDGLELVRKCKTANFPAKFIIISGYKQFEYAQRAMNDGVREFLLKPIKKNDINSSLHRVIAQVKNDTSVEKKLLDLQEKEQLLDDIREHSNEIFIESILSEQIPPSLDDTNKNNLLSFKEGIF